MASETVDAVLAEMRANSRFENGRWVHVAATGPELERWADRLAAAHAAEKEAAERDARRAVGLLREVRGYLSAAEESSMSRNNSEQLAYEFGERIDALLSEQAGERENATKESAHED